MGELPFDFGRGHAKLDAALSYLNISGARAHGMFRQSGAYVEGETITIGTDVIEIVVVNDDSGDDTQGGDFNNTDNPLIVDMTPYAALRPGGTAPLRMGELIRINTEILRVAAIDGPRIAFARGQMGSAAAAHVNGANILTDGNYASDTRIPVCASGGTSLTAENIGDALRVCVNNKQGQFTDGGAGPVHVREVVANGAGLLFALDQPGEDSRAVAEAGANSSWDHTSFEGGETPRTQRRVLFSRSPRAAEVAAGEINIPVDFDPTAVLVDVKDSNDDPKAWNGATTVTDATGLEPAYVTIDNTGATDWAATDTVTALILE